MENKINMNFKVVLFDAGNTLLNINFIYIQTVLDSFGFSFSLDEIQKAEAVARKEMDEYYHTTKMQTELMSSFELYISKCLEKLNITDQHTKKNIINFLLQKHISSNIYDYITDETKEILKYCFFKNYRLGIVSNSRGDVKDLLKKCKIEKYFEHIIDSSEVGVEKPNKKIFLIALDLFKVQAKDCIYIGDLYYIDIVGAMSAGIKAVLLDKFDLYSDKECLRISNLLELKKIL